MCTNKSLSPEERDEIHELILDAVNASANDEDSTPINDRLLYKLDRLRLKYGELPEILATRADSIESIDERLRLYKRAVELAQKKLDIASLTQSAESITIIYIDELSDYNNGLHWLNQLKKFITLHGDDYTCDKLSNLKANLNRLKIKSV